MPQFTRFADLRSSAGTLTSVGYDFGTLFEGLATRGELDIAIVSTEDGFSPLGASSNFFERDLQISYDKEIRPLANWNRSENDRVTLIAIKSQNPLGYLRGVILAPGNNTQSYKRYSQSAYKGPNRAFYYNISYEAIAFACRNWGVKKIGISHLSGSGQYHQDMATCHAEALAHFCDQEPLAAPQSFVFCGCCITKDHIKGIGRLNTEGNITKHFPIQVETELRSCATLLHLDWSRAP